MAFDFIVCPPFNPKGIPLVLLVFHQYFVVIKCVCYWSNKFKKHMESI